ncbi:MAG: hypothetical protein RI580_18320 [Halothece sp. Uz-M2-17]|nr:hypothetical protein [Halothece sp. Uz-M2-17]
MEGYKALDKTLKRFHLQAKTLAKKADINPVQLSRYRNGSNDLYSETLLRIVRNLPAEAKGYYWLLTMTEDEEEENDEVKTAKV